MDRLHRDHSNQLICISQGECTGRSIVKALDNFLTAVQRMKETVMMPSRLRDLSANVGDDVGSAMSIDHPPTTMAVRMTGAGPGYPLYNFYQMLQMIRNELVSGPTADDDRLKSEEDGDDETVRRLSNAFQQHLQGLFSILLQLTDAANYLTKRYQDDFDASVLPPPLF
ncbi:gastrulation specific protein G12 [Trichuris trichiura]|uniref:Gastrulation specific protein G12 n=1 Tax=Trichuris trichiura TaxID=36087 RepID=A0A077Z156_TRITR|nr:gastrulation specific protein G12 [Trichuris trichiura]